MATYGPGQSVTDEVNATHTGAGAAVLYTAPADGYAIVQCYCEALSSAGPLWFTIDGRRVSPNMISAVGAGVHNVYIGPQQAISVNGTGAADQGSITGVEFTNQT